MRAWASPSRVVQPSGLRPSASAPPSQAVGAQGASCPFNSCDFLCLTQTHEWTQDGIDGIWVIVDAVPRYGTCASPPCARWYDNGSPSWAPLDVVGVWERSGASDITSSVAVGNDGHCTYGDNKGDFILCHDFKVDSQSSDLCDSYGGNWDRIASGTSTSCLQRVEYGFDFRKEITVDGAIFCFKKATVTSLEPTGSGALQGRVKTSAGGCGSVLDWSAGESVDTTQCVTLEESRPGGSNAVRMTVHYDYVPHT